ncbi:MAG: hypothetical protein Q7W45_15860 [Bacteroidota bacterium]|nr:hypothetical protein [Bacteroidota bacterium]MDP3145509.1 hypothetical protein [Bacteroidota bacterium]MDP3556469.1 hypothetical protein [Bacteroidota bacterium]
MKKVLLIILLFTTCFKVKAQFLDTLHEVFKNKSSIDARLESRNSFINNQIISISGLRLGVTFQRKLRVGGGVSWMKSSFSENFYLQNENGKIDTVLKYLKLAYLSYYIDFVFYKTKRWQLSVPIQAGTGFSWWQQNKTYSLNNPEKKYFLFLYEPGVTAQFKVFRWFGLGTDVAYRFTLKNNKKIGERLNSPTYSFKILVWFDQLYYELLPKSKITKKYGPPVW